MTLSLFFLIYLIVSFVLILFHIIYFDVLLCEKSNLYSKYLHKYSIIFMIGIIPLGGISLDTVYDANKKFIRTEELKSIDGRLHVDKGVVHVLVNVNGDVEKINISKYKLVKTEGDIILKHNIYKFGLIEEKEDCEIYINSDLISIK